MSDPQTAARLAAGPRRSGPERARDTADPKFLEIRDITLTFSGITALKDITLDVARGELVAIIGPNGAGKTSLFNCISGAYRPTRGEVVFDGRSLAKVPPHIIASRGVGRMFQNLALFDHLTVLDNLLLGRHHLIRSNFLTDLVWFGRTRSEEVAHRKYVERMVEFVHLERYRKTPVGILPYGVKKRIELARALCMEPQLLLLDEPAAGLNAEETEDMARYILDIKEELGITQLLIDHELRFVLELADRICVLNFGQKIAEGPPAAVQSHPAVIAAYVGAQVPPPQTAAAP
jgi:branched-chain amino acid transport system ATP-binding protein